MKQLNRNQLAAAVFGAVVTQTALVTPVFGYEFLAHGYQNSPLTQPDGAAEQDKDTAQEQKTKEGKCGEGKCGEGKCGADKAKDAKAKDGKCGEGKCGADKKKDGKAKDASCGALA